jgi:hypothetical protein
MKSSEEIVKEINFARCFPEKLDVRNDQIKLESLVKSHDIVIPFVPLFLHILCCKTLFTTKQKFGCCILHFV